MNGISDAQANKMALENIGLAHTFLRRQMTTAHPDYEDRVQELWLALRRAAKGFRDRGGTQFGTYAWTVMRNDQHSWRRKELARAACIGALPEDYYERTGVSGEQERCHEYLDLARAIRKLPRHLRVTMQLLVEEKLSRAATAKRLKMSPQAVSSRVQTAVRMLRTIMGDGRERR